MSPYERGFIDKCAEFSIDPWELLKTAGLAENRAAMLQAYQDQFGKNAPARVEGYLAPDGSWGFDRSKRAPGSRTYTVVGGSRPPMRTKPANPLMPPRAPDVPVQQPQPYPTDDVFGKYPNLANIRVTPYTPPAQPPAPVPPTPAPAPVPRPATVAPTPTPDPQVAQAPSDAYDFDAEDNIPEPPGMQGLELRNHMRKERIKMRHNSMLAAYQKQFGKPAPAKTRGYLSPDGQWSFNQ